MMERKASINTSACCIVYFFVANFYGAVPMAACMLLIILSYAFETHGKLTLSINNHLILYLILFAIYTSATTLWARDAHYALDMGFLQLMIAGTMIVFYSCFRKRETIVPILYVIMISGYAIILYFIYSVGFNSVLNWISSAYRFTVRDTTQFNPNSVGAFASYSILINIYLILYKKKSFNVFDFLIIPAFLVMIVSQSRKAVLILLAGIILLSIMKNYQPGNSRKLINSLIKVIIALAFLFTIIIVLSKTQAFSNVVHRLSLVSSAIAGNRTDGWLRMQYQNLGIDLFKESPLFGIGADNSRIYTSMYYGFDVYLHNNYLELLATQGLCGAILYYSIYMIIIYRLIIYRSLRDEEYDITLVLLTIRLFADLVQVTYYSKETAFYLLMFWLETEKLKRNHLEKRNI